MSAREILVVDDEVGIRELLRDILLDEGYQVRLAENAAEARSLRQQFKPDLVLLDIWMPDCDGISLLKEWGNAGLLTMPVVMMSGHGTIDTAVEATRIGAFDFLEKPIALQKLLKTVNDALKHADQTPKTDMNLLMLCKSQLMTELRNQLDQFAEQFPAVLLLGEHATAAYWFAKFFHASHTPWLTLENLDRLTKETSMLLEELQGGVLFIEELSRLDRSQQKGLIVLINKAEQFQLKIICASQHHAITTLQLQLGDYPLIEKLQSSTAIIPQLNQHRDDVPDIARALGLILVESKHLPYREFDTAALNALRKCDWRENISQLHDSVSLLLQRSSGEKITEQDVIQLIELQASQSTQSGHTQGGEMSFDQPLRQARDDFERLYFEYHIEKAARNMSKVAENVEMERTHLYRKLKQLGIKIK